MNLFFDTEFTTLNKNDNPKIISIGFVDQLLERTFYAELTDSYQEKNCNLFVLDEVLPLLDAKPVNVDTLIFDIFTDDIINNDHIYVSATVEVVRQKLIEWMSAFNENIQLFADAPSYDLHMLQQLMGHNFWFKNVNKKVLNTLPKTYANQEIYNSIIEDIYDNQHFRKHHALDDAYAMRITWLKMNDQLN